MFRNIQKYTFDAKRGMMDDKQMNLKLPTT